MDRVTVLYPNISSKERDRNAQYPDHARELHIMHPTDQLSQSLGPLERGIEWRCEMKVEMLKEGSKLKACRKSLQG